MELYKMVRTAWAERMSRGAAAKHFNISRGTVDKMLAFSVPLGHRRDKPIRRPKLDGFSMQGPSRVSDLRPPVVQPMGLSPVRGHF